MGDLLLPVVPSFVATFNAERDVIMPLAQWTKQNNRDPDSKGQGAYIAMAASYNSCIEFLIASIDAGIDQDRLPELRKRVEQVDASTKAFLAWYQSLGKKQGQEVTAYSPTGFPYADTLLKAAEVAVGAEAGRRTARSERIGRLTTSLRLCKWKMWSEL